MAKLFSFDLHPEWLEQLSRPKHEQHRLGRLATAIMYSSDVALQFLKLKSIRKLNNQAKRKEMEQTVKIQEEQSQADLAPCLQHAPVSVQLPGGHASDHMFFKVLSTSVGNLKTVRRAPASKLRLHKGDIALTFHKAETVSDSGRDMCMVHAQPLTCSAGGAAIHVLGAVGMDAESVGQVVKWQPGGLGCLTLPNYATQADSSLLQRLMAAKAFEGQESGLPDTALSGAMRTCLQDMEHDGWVVSDSTHGWQLTKKALSSMSVARSVEDPCAFEDCPALEDRTCYELLKLLKDQGWEWKHLKRGQPVPYTLGGSKTWYSRGCQISKAYLLSLLQAESLLQPGQEIHHSMKAKYYQCLLQGEYESALALLPQHQVQGQAPALEDESGPAQLALLPEDDFLWCPPSSVPTGPTAVPVPRDTCSEAPPRRPRHVASRKRKREHLPGHRDDSVMTRGFPQRLMTHSMACGRTLVTCLIATLMMIKVPNLLIRMMMMTHQAWGYELVMLQVPWSLVKLGIICQMVAQVCLTPSLALAPALPAPPSPSAHTGPVPEARVLFARRQLLLGGALLAKSLGVLLVAAAGTVHGRQRAHTMPEMLELDAAFLTIPMSREP